MEGHHFSGPVGVQPCLAVGDYGLREGVEGKPSHGVAHGRLADSGVALPCADLEKRSDSASAAWTAVVHGERVADLRRVDGDPGLFLGLANQRGTHVLVRAVDMT